MRKYPKPNQIFRLTLDGRDPNNHPLAMVRRHQCLYPSSWRYCAKPMLNRETRRFKVVLVDCSNDWKQIVANLKTKGHIPKTQWLKAWKQLIPKLESKGLIPGGQWLEAFQARFPEHDGNEPVAVADNHWLDPEGDARFPQIHRDGGFEFAWVGIISDHCRWLVEVK